MKNKKILYKTCFYNFLSKFKKLCAIPLSISQNLAEYYNFTLQYSSNWFSLLKFSGFYGLFIVFFRIIMEFTLNFEQTRDNMGMVLMSYFAMSSPSFIMLYFTNRYNNKNLDFPKYKKIKIIVSLTTTSLMLFIWITNFNFELEKEMNKKHMDLFLYTYSSCIIYFIFWVLNPIFKLKIIVLLIHFPILLLAEIVFLKVDYYHIFKSLIMFFFTSIIMILYSNIRDKQIFDSYAASKKKEVILEDWKDMVNDFPNGVILISLDKKIQYVNKNVAELFHIKQECFLTSFEKSSRTNKSNTLRKKSKFRNNDKEKKKIEKPFNSHAQTIDPNLLMYDTLVEKIGKIEEVSPIKDSLDTVNLELNKSGAGYSIIESEYPKDHRWKKNKLNVASVNVNSNYSLPEMIREPLSMKTMKKFQSLRRSASMEAELSPFTINRIIKDGMACHSMKVDLVNIEFTLDDVINKIKKRIISNSRKTNMNNYSAISEIKTYCTQYKNFNENEMKSKKKYEIKIKPIVYRSETVLLLILQDVSYMDLVKELRENNEYKTKVITTLSHELRTPLNGAITPIEQAMQIAENSGQEVSVYKELNVAYKSLILLQSVLNDVVDFALINSNQLYLNFEEMNFSKFLQDTLDLFSQQADEKSIELNLLMDSRYKIPRNFKTDFQRLRQILVSLINNSLKNTFSGGIKLKVEILKRLTQSPRETKLKKLSQTTPIAARGVNVKGNFEQEVNSLTTDNNIFSLDSKELVLKKPQFPTENEELLGEKKEIEMEKSLNPFLNENFSVNAMDKSFKMKNKSNALSLRDNFIAKLPNLILKISIEDTGTGIEPEKLEMIKKSLSSVDILEVCVGLNRKKGCGLGLTISHCLSLLLGPQENRGLEIKSEFQKGTEVNFSVIGFIENDVFSAEESKNEFTQSFSPRNLSKSTRNKQSIFSNLKIIPKSESYAHINRPTAINNPPPKVNSFQEIELFKTNPNQTSHHNNQSTIKSNNDEQFGQNDLVVSDFMSSHLFQTHYDALYKKNSLNYIKMSSKETTNSIMLEKMERFVSRSGSSNLGIINYNKESVSFEDSKSNFSNYCICAEILIVDDDAFNLMALENNIKRLQLKAKKAFNGQQAIDILKAKRKCCENCCLFQLIMLDYHMPIKNGVETAIVIAEMVRNGEIPIIPIVGCTAYGARDLVDEWKSVGVTDILIKPLKLDKLEQVFKEWKIIPIN